MSLSPIPYTLDSKQLEAALAALTKAAEALRPTRRELRLYFLLGMCAKAAAGTFVIGATLVALSQTEVAKIDDAVIGAVGLGFLVSGAAAALLLLANVALIRDTLRQRSLVKRMGLHEVSYSAWKADLKRSPLARFGGILMTMFAVVMLVFMGFWALGTEGTDVMELVLGFSMLVVGLVILAFRFLQRLRDQLEVIRNADRLHEALAAMQTGARGELEVPAALLESVARIETVQIARERADAVLAGIKAADRGYAVISSREVTEQKAALPPARRLELEELIDDIAADPHAMARSLTPDGGHKRARSADGGIEVAYDVDETQRRIEIALVRTVRSAADVTEGLRHAR